MNASTPIRPPFVEAPSNPSLNSSSRSSWEGRQVCEHSFKPVFHTEIDIEKWIIAFEEFKIKYAEIYKRKHRDFILPAYRT